MKLLLLLTLIISPLFSFASAWEPIIDCSKASMVVDEKVINQNIVYQLVIRDQNAVKSLAQLGQFESYINDNEELLFKLELSNNGYFYAAGFPNGNKLSIYLDMKNRSTKIIVEKFHYYGRTFEFLTEWEFKNCIFGKF